MVPEHASVAVAPLSTNPGFMEAVGRMRAAFIEMPGLKLTPPQAARLCAIDQATCAAVLSSLVEDRFLVVSRNAYVRA